MGNGNSIEEMMPNPYGGLNSLVIFLDRLFPWELREEKAEDFVNLKQGRMTIKEYALKFHQLS